MSDFAISFFVFIGGLALGAILGAGIAGDVWRKEAVDAGKAEFYLDTEHRRQWRWAPTMIQMNNEFKEVKP